MSTIGRPYSPDDLTSPWNARMGEDVRLDTGEAGFISQVTEDGLVSIEGYGGLCTALVPADELEGRIVGHSAEFMQDEYVALCEAGRIAEAKALLPLIKEARGA